MITLRHVMPLWLDALQALAGALVFSTLMSHTRLERRPALALASLAGPVLAIAMYIVYWHGGLGTVVFILSGSWGDE